MSTNKIIGVNGFGRIGRYLTRLAILDPEVEVSLVNDLSDVHTLMHLFKYDSVHGRFDIDFKIEGNVVLFENGKKMSFSQQRDPGLIEWSKFGVSTVVECTGLFVPKGQRTSNQRLGLDSKEANNAQSIACTTTPFFF